MGKRLVLQNGTRFGKLTVVGFVGVVNNDGVHKVVCECGFVKNVRTAHLKSGASTSCNRGKCNHRYKGGQRTEGSVAWANQRISRVNWEAKRGGHALLSATAEQLAFMFLNSNGRCNACHRKRKPLCIDHCHETGLLRGILCSQCNTAVGMCGESERVWNAIKRYMNSVVLQRPLKGVLVGREG